MKLEGNRKAPFFKLPLQHTTFDLVAGGRPGRAPSSSPQASSPLAVPTKAQQPFQMTFMFLCVFLNRIYFY